MRNEPFGPFRSTSARRCVDDHGVTTNNPTSSGGRTQRLTRIASAIALVATSLFVMAPAASAATSADAATYNPWGFENDQTLTEAEASAVLLHQVNMQRQVAGLTPLAPSADRSGAQCSVAAIVNNDNFRHYRECIPSNHYENIYGSFSSGSAVVEAAGPWARSTSGHNEAMYSPTATHAQMSVRCTTTSEWRSEGYVAFQPVNANGYTTARPSRSNVAQLDRSDDLYASTGVACDGTTLRFRLAAELRGLSPEVAEPEIDAATPQTWYRYQIARLYSAYFDRAPDNAGWAYWNQRSVDGLGLWQASDYFADSDEFKRLYGEQLSNAAFLELVYENVLDRSPDTGGLEYWVQRMNSGTTRGEVMVFFSESPEYIAQVGPAMTGECWNGIVSSAYLCAAASTAAPSGS